LIGSLAGLNETRLMPESALLGVPPWENWTLMRFFLLWQSDLKLQQETPRLRCGRPPNQPRPVPTAPAAIASRAEREFTITSSLLHLLRRPNPPSLSLPPQDKPHPGAVPPSLPALSQVEEMVIVRVHVQMVIKRVRGH